MPSVLIVGGGVSGLTSALQLARAGYDVEIWQSSRGQAPPNWVWEYPPFHVEPQELAFKWSRISLKEFTRLSTIPESNVHIIPVCVLSKEKMDPNPGADFLPNFKHGKEALAEAHRLLWTEQPTQRKYVDSHFYHAPVCDSVKYLAWLQKEIKAMGGRIIRRTVSSIEEALTEAKVVVNCSGMGAQEIVPDKDVYPCRGELLHVHAPWVKAAVFDDLDDGYVIPCPGSDLELGGTADDHAYERVFSKANTQRILKGNIEMIPSLEKAEVGDGWVGFRPSRSSGVRLELEWRAGEGAQKRALIHNYGHSGSGMNLSYGCADEVVRLVGDAFSRLEPKANL